MPLDISFVTDGEWGPGTGIIHDAHDADEIIYRLKTAVEFLQDNPPPSDDIVSITHSAATATYHFFSGRNIGPLPLPILEYRDRGEFEGFSVYAPLDIVSHVGSVYSVQLDHTAAATFDELATASPQLAGSFVVGRAYKIDTVGSTDFTAIGATDNTVGTVFFATGVGTGDGLAGQLLYKKIIGPTADVVIADAAADRTLTMADMNAYVRTSSAAPITRTIPDDSVPFPTGSTVTFEQAGAGEITIAGDVGVTLNFAATHTPVTHGQFAVCQIKKVGPNEWTLFGNLIPA